MAIIYANQDDPSRGFQQFGQSMMQLMLAREQMKLDKERLKHEQDVNNAAEAGRQQATAAVLGATQDPGLMQQIGTNPLLAAQVQQFQHSFLPAGIGDARVRMPDIQQSQHVAQTQAAAIAPEIDKLRRRGQTLKSIDEQIKNVASGFTDPSTPEAKQLIQQRVAGLRQLRSAVEAGDEGVDSTTLMNNLTNAGLLASGDAEALKLKAGKLEVQQTESRIQADAQAFQKLQQLQPKVFEGVTQPLPGSAQALLNFGYLKEQEAGSMRVEARRHANATAEENQRAKNEQQSAFNAAVLRSTEMLYGKYATQVVQTADGQTVEVANPNAWQDASLEAIDMLSANPYFNSLSEGARRQYAENITRLAKTGAETDNEIGTLLRQQLTTDVSPGRLRTGNKWLSIGSRQEFLLPNEITPETAAKMKRQVIDALKGRGYSEASAQLMLRQRQFDERIAAANAAIKDLKNSPLDLDRFRRIAGLNQQDLQRQGAEAATFFAAGTPQGSVQLGVLLATKLLDDLEDRIRPLSPEQDARFTQQILDNTMNFNRTQGRTLQNLNQSAFPR